jgi:hypothetical protein
MLNKQNTTEAQPIAQQPLESIEAYWRRRATEQLLRDSQTAIDCLFLAGIMPYTEYVMATLDIQIKLDNLEVR